MGYMSPNLKLINGETGEVVEDKVIVFGRKPTDTGYVKVFVTFLEDVVLNEKVAGKAIRLLLYAVHKVNWNNLEVYLFHKTVCEHLGISKKTYFRWLKELMDNGYIEDTDNKYVYRLKPYSCVKGSMDKVKD